VIFDLRFGNHRLVAESRNQVNPSNPKYDALLVVSFGGPEGMGDVIPFLENVLHGRNIPRERMLAVAKHYEMFDGVSPINECNRQLIKALKQELQTHGPDLPIYWGNRNWHPLLPDTVAQMSADGIQRALAFVTAGYSSYSSCRQYLQNIEDARKAVGEHAPHIDKLRAFYNHPLFIEANAAHVRTAINSLEASDQPHLVFTAHSIPEAMAKDADYAAQLSEASRLVAEAVEIENWELVYQSRSGAPSQPWLGPDVCDHLNDLHSAGVSKVVVVPIGFVSDHMEVIYDLDVEAQEVAKGLGMRMARAATAGTHPSFVKMIRELISERTDNLEPRFLGTRGAAGNSCAPDCCLRWNTY
jgi:ferrochelatase